MSKAKVAAIAVILALGASIAWGEEVVEILQELNSAPAAVPASPVSSPESTDLSTPVRPRLTRKAKRVIVAPTSSVANVTACIEVVVFQRVAGTTTYGTVATVQTITFGSTGETGSISGRFPSYDYLSAQTLGCQVYDVRLLYVSSGNVTWTSWTLGTNTVKAGTTDE